jgi:general secretion pathway protein L
VRRPDFLDGVGIYVGPTDLAIAAVTKRLFQVRLRHAHVTSIPPPEAAAERRQAIVAVVKAFLADHQLDASHTTVAIPRSELAVTRVLLPAAAKENLAQVLEYEMENLVPLQRDEVFHDHTTRPLGEERIAVLLACVPRDPVRVLLDTLEEAGVRPRAISLASTALADYVGFAKGEVPAAMGLVVRTPAATEVALFARGDLAASQLVPAARGTDAGSLERALVRQLGDEAFDAEETVRFQWTLGDGEPLPETLGEAGLRALARGRLTADDGFFTDPHPASLIAVGGALAAVREGASKLNLLPAENREAFDEGPSIATWILLAASALLLVVWGASAIVKDRLLLRDLEARLEAVAPDVREVKTIQGEIEEMQRQVDILGSGQDGRVTTLLKDLTEIIPVDAYLTTMNLRGGRLTLDGQARSASDIITGLEKSKRFKSVAFSSPTTRQGDKERFAITAEVVK